MQFKDQVHYRRNLPDRLRAISQAHSQRPALSVGGETWLYEELFAAAQFQAIRMESGASKEAQQPIAILVGRTIASYVGALSCFLSGRAYLPLSPHHPPRRHAIAIESLKVTQLICDASSLPIVERIFKEKASLRERIKLTILGETKADYSLAIQVGERPAISDPQQLAYVLYTSGSTGEPKAVPVRNRNLLHYLDAASEALDIRANDKLSQTFELTFDLSVHDLLIAWTHGAHLIAASKEDLIDPADYIRRNGITCWFSVPTLAFQIKSQDRLLANSLPSLRWSLFCGEPLPLELARQWEIAAPNSRIENWYGPTEATIACTRFRIDGEATALHGPTDVAPIGYPLTGMSIRVVNEKLEEVPRGTEGELLLCGPQVCDGYLDNAARTSEAFVNVPFSDQVYYRSGDRVLQDESGLTWFLGRLDNQVKIRGFRVELGEIETAFRKILGSVNLLAFACQPPGKAGSTIVLAIESEEIDVSEALVKVREELPDFMIPAATFCLPTFPRTTSGKADRKQILENLYQRMSQNAEATVLPGELDEHSTTVLALIRRTNPHLPASCILKAPSLMEAGIDSLGFIDLTHEMERAFTLRITANQVSQLAQLSFSEFSAFFAQSAKHANKSRESQVDTQSVVLPSANAQHPKPDRGQSRWVNRVIQFVRRYPHWVSGRVSTHVPAIGSSGIFRGFSTEDYDRHTKRTDPPIASANLGFPAIDAHGIALICRYVQQQAQNWGAQFPLAIYELDPMLLSLVPPPADIDLQESHFSGLLIPVDYPSDTIGWHESAAGMPNLADRKPLASSTPQWLAARELQIMSTFRGEIGFDPRAVEAWLRGYEYLKSCSDEVVVFVHPLDAARFDRNMPGTGVMLNQLFKTIAELSSARVIDWKNFDISSEDFLDLNHVRGGFGSPKLTQQLVALIEGTINGVT